MHFILIFGVWIAIKLYFTDTLHFWGGLSCGVRSEDAFLLDVSYIIILVNV